MVNYCLTLFPFRYCAGKPKPKTIQEEWHVVPNYFYINGIEKRSKTICELDHATCGLCLIEPKGLDKSE